MIIRIVTPSYVTPFLCFSAFVIVREPHISGNLNPPTFVYPLFIQTELLRVGFNLD